MKLICCKEERRRKVFQKHELRSLEPVNTPQGRAKLTSFKQCSPRPRRINRLYDCYIKFLPYFSLPMRKGEEKYSGNMSYAV